MAYTTLIVKYQLQGFHYWPDAIDHRRYLKVVHSHIFHVGVLLTTQSPTFDREIELHDLRDSLKSVCEDCISEEWIDTPAAPNNVSHLSDSVETMARNITHKLAETYADGLRLITTTVMEDDDVGASYTLGPPRGKYSKSPQS